MNTAGYAGRNKGGIVSMINNCKWQWMDNHFGPMGWFSDRQKVEHEGTAEFLDGYWRLLSESEVAFMSASVSRLAYEQS